MEFFLMFHKEKPIDWLLDHILYVKVCNPEKDTVSMRFNTTMVSEMCWKNITNCHQVDKCIGITEGGGGGGGVKSTYATSLELKIVASKDIITCLLVDIWVSCLRCYKA